jgi:hypothetical protein
LDWLDANLHLRCLASATAITECHVSLLTPRTSGLATGCSSRRAIWIQFIRYLLIYPEAQPTLFHVYEQFAQSKCRYFTRESFVFCARCYVSSRDKHESKWLRRKFRRLSRRIDRAKRNVVSLWSSIINNTSTLTFKLSRVIAERFAAIDADFWDLTVHFPQNSGQCALASETTLSIRNCEQQLLHMMFLVRTSQGNASHCRIGRAVRIFLSIDLAFGETFWMEIRSQE